MFLAKNNFVYLSSLFFLIGMLLFLNACNKDNGIDDEKNWEEWQAENDWEDWEDEDEDWEEDNHKESQSLLLSEIPQAVLETIEELFPDAEIEEAEMEFNGNIEIFLDNEVFLYFDDEGELIYIEDYEEYERNELERDIPLGELPDLIFDYIAANYPNLKIAQADFLEDVGYKVRLENDIELYFDEDGNFEFVETEFRLKFVLKSFPDTVILGTTVVLEGDIINNNQEYFRGDLRVPFGVEDDTEIDITTAMADGEETFDDIAIAPGASLPISIPVTIDSTNFNPATYDIIIVWPEVITSGIVNPFVLGGGHSAKATFVEN